MCFFGHNYLGVVFAISILLMGCSNQEDVLFKTISADQSNIHFANRVEETDSFNILNFHYIYNGGGVGVADFDKNGLVDLVFSGNQLESKIYLNQDKFNFLDITENANFKTIGWATGISIVDINADGWPDIYISVGGLSCDGNCNNQLFIHQGLDDENIPQFKEEAANYGLQDPTYTQQAAFFDYDLDGDLDVYLLHNAIDQRDKNAPSEKHFITKRSADVLLENIGNKQFRNVSDSLGIVHRGYGLGVTINDFNHDQLPDIYVANDFLSDDLMYLNKGMDDVQHLGFEEVGQQTLKHMSYNSMGVDVADVNNDAQPDIVVLDMLPANNERQKTSQGFMNYNKFLLSLRQGYAPQFIRNTLQVHNGFLNGELLPFSETAYLSGMYNTDWSWTPLLADFDNDGDRDLFVTNGYGKDITDLDFINYSQERNPFGTKETQQKELFTKVQEMDPITLPNYIFENQGNLQFENQNGTWIKQQKSISNGAVYADLDNDGDLDLIVNNLNEKAYLLENQTNQKTTNAYLKIQLKGPAGNSVGIGAKLSIWSEGNEQLHFQSPVRGYLSSVDPMIHFGLGNVDKLDSIIIIWPGNRIEKQINIAVNQTIELAFANATVATQPVPNKITSTLFSSSSELESYQHRENIGHDFNAQPLLLQQRSRQGPCLLAANVNGEEGEEIFIGGAKGQASVIYQELPDGTYQYQALSHAEREDLAACFFDFDQDNDLDLYVVSGGVEYGDSAIEYTDRLYLNNGLGVFTYHNIPLPNSSGSCVVANDFDQDGDIDIWVGARLIPNNYPYTPKSSLLLNEGGLLKEIATPFDSLGMITDAIWADIDNDQWDDLIIVGEWMPITICKNKNGQFLKENIIEIEQSNGLWNCIATADFDRDGDLDFMLGNLGTNSRLKASEKEPLFLYRKDYDQNGSPDPLIGQYYADNQGNRKLFPLHSRDDVMMQLTVLKKRIVTYEAFGNTSFEELLGLELSDDNFLQLTCLQSSYLENLGNSQFSLQPLPQEVQLAPIQSILVEDFNGDDILDLLMTGNDFGSEKNMGWYDAFNGALLLADEKEQFKFIPAANSGFYIPEDGRDLVNVKKRNGQKMILAAQNNSNIKAFYW